MLHTSLYQEFGSSAPRDTLDRAYMVDPPHQLVLVLSLLVPTMLCLDLSQVMNLSSSPEDLQWEYLNYRYLTQICLCKVAST